MLQFYQITTRKSKDQHNFNRNLYFKANTIAYLSYCLVLIFKLKTKNPLTAILLAHDSKFDNKDLKYLNINLRVEISMCSILSNKPNNNT